MKFLIPLIAFVVGFVAFYLLMHIGAFDALDLVKGTEIEPNLSTPTYLSFVSVMMTAVTTVLAALAVAIGVAAWYSFREIKTVAADVATDTAANIATKEANKILNPDSVERIVIKAMLSMNLDTNDNQEEDDNETQD